MAGRHKHEEHENHERWLVSYADFITLLFAFFVVMYSVSALNEGKFKVVAQSIQEALKPIIKKESANLRYDVGQSQSAIVPAISPKVQFLKKAHAVLNPFAHDAKFQNQIMVTETEHGILVTLAESLMFQSGQADIKQAALPVLEALAEVLTDPDQQIKEVRIEGHTDDVPIRTPQFSSNWELSAMRAVMVLRVMTELYKVEPGVVSATGYAEFKPVTDNLTPEHRAQNRRVELNVIMD
ncbi:MAG: flagellar motor protein MotB [Nitrospirota bacterium]